MKPSILFIVPADYEELKEKGVEGMILERDERGFFGKVITVHPVARRSRTLRLNECHEVHEIGFDLIAGARKNRFLRCIQYPIHFFRVVRSVIMLLRSRHISLIRANDPFWMGLYALVGSRICGIPFCVSIHADYDRRMQLDRSISMTTVFGSYRLAKMLSRFVLTRAGLIFPIRESLREKLIADGARADRTKVIPHGIELSFFKKTEKRASRERFQIAEGKKIVSYVGRLSRENYIDDVLAIARRLAGVRDDFVVVVAGGGKEEARIQALVAADAVLAKSVLLAGWQTRDVCLELRQDSDASLCLMAGFSLIEACAAGRPVVSYDVEWHHELVKNDESGFLIEEGSIEGVVDALRWIFDHPEAAASMGKKARALAFDRHDLVKTSAIKVRWYSEILAKGI